MSDAIQKKRMKYSVLMSVYDKEKPAYLRQSIESMLAQTVKPEQFIIVEDGPVSKELKQVISGFTDRDPALFTIIQKEHNEGLASALNTGIAAARNELVARMDSDDISLPERCEKELDAFEKDPSLDICGCQLGEFIHDDPDNVVLYRLVPTDDAAIKKFMHRRQPFNHPSVIYKKSAVLKYGGYEKLKRKEDFDLFSKMLTGGCRARNVDEVLYLYRNDEKNYKRRKSWTNTSAALHVYWRHFRRGGCSFPDFLLISCAELAFFILPLNLMKYLSDHLLRKADTVSK